MEKSKLERDEFVPGLTIEAIRANVGGYAVLSTFTVPKYLCGGSRGATNECRQILEVRQEENGSVTVVLGKGAIVYATFGETEIAYTIPDNCELPSFLVKGILSNSRLRDLLDNHINFQDYFIKGVLV